MTLPRKLALVTVALLMGLCVSASAMVSHSHLVGDLVTTEDGLICNAVVSQVGNVYTYDYTLIYTAGIGPIHIFDVENPNAGAFFDAVNQPVGKPDEFTDPADGNAGWVDWIDGEIRVGDTRTFSYKSYYAPMEIEVWTYVINGGTSAVGTTLGMRDMIPEPSSLAALLFGAAGLLPLVIKRRK